MLSEDEVAQRKDLRDRRDLAILRLLWDTGMRISELTGLDLNHLDLDQEVVVIMGKGSRPRACPFGPRTGRALDRYRGLATPPATPTHRACSSPSADG